MPKELWKEVHSIVQEVVIKTIPKRNKCKKAKWLFEGALQIAEKRREATGKGEKIKIVAYGLITSRQIEGGKVGTVIESVTPN